MKIFYSLLAAVILFGCYSEKKLAQICLDKFPNDTTEVLIVDTLVQLDSIKIVAHDTLINVDSFYIDTSKVIKKTIYKYIKPTIELTMLNAKRIEDSSRYYVAVKMHKIDLEKKQKEIDKLKDSLNDVKKYRYYFYISILLMIIFALVTFKWFTLR